MGDPMTFKLKLREDRPATIEERRELINRIAMLEAVIANTIESIERGSTSAPVLECLKAAVPHLRAEVDQQAIDAVATAISGFAPDLAQELVARWRAAKEGIFIRREAEHEHQEDGLGG